MNIPTDEMQKYLKMLIKRKKLFIILSLCVMSAMVWGSYFMTKKYKAESTVFIEQNVIKKLVEGIAITPSIEDRLRVLRYAMLSRTHILKVVKALDLDTKAKTDKELEEMIEKYQKQTELNVRGNDLFIVSILDQDPKLAMNYVNTLISLYIEENVAAKREEAFGAGRFLKEQLVSLKEKLDRADEAVIKYRQEKGVYLADDEKTIATEIKNYLAQMDYVKVTKNELSATLNSLKTQMKSVQPYTVSLIKHSGNSNLTSLENQLNTLLMRYTDNHPEVVRLRALIEEMKGQQKGSTQKGQGSQGDPEQSTINPVYQELEQKTYEIESEIHANEAKQRQLQAMISAKERELRNMPESKKRLAELERDRDTQMDLYNKLLARQGQSDVSKQMEAENKSTTFRVVDPAVLPMKPASPNRVRIFMMALVLGLAGGAAGVLAREAFDSSIKQAGTLKQLGLQVLAVIPNIYNEEEQEVRQKEDKMLYAVAGSYFLVICVTIVLELMGFSYIDVIASHLSVGGLLNGIKQTAKSIL